MVRIAGGAFLAVVVLCFAGVPATLAQDDPAQIVDKAIESSGGKENLEKAKSLTWTEAGKMKAAGGESTYKAKCAMQRPGKMKREMELQINGQAVPIVVVFNGQKGMRKTPLTQGNPKAIEGEELNEMKEQMWADSLRGLLPLKGSDVKLATTPGIDVQSRPTRGVAVTKSGLREVKLYFDKETGLLVKVERQAPQLQSGVGSLVKNETIFSNHKDVSGVKLPHKVTILQDGEPYVETELTDLKVQENLPADTFNF